MLYLDNAATTPVLPAALEAAWPWLTSEFGNPSSTHELGSRAAKALSNARAAVANWLGCRESEITFTSGATESNNLAIKGIALANPRGKHIISARTEHESVLETLAFLERVHQFEIEWMPLNQQGEIDPAELETRLRADTTLVTLMTVNNEIGTIHDIKSLAEIAKAKGVPFHTDAVQAAGWLDISVKETAVSALSLSGHKFGAPKGIGVLYASSRLTLEPLIHGGGQEFERRSGTENVAWAVAFATAIEKLATPQPVAADFIESVLSEIPNAALTGSEKRHPGIASFVFEGINGETLLLELENRGVICSSGSACAAGSNDPSHVLLALGYDPDLARTAVRFSFGLHSEPRDAEFALKALKAALEKIAG